DGCGPRVNGSSEVPVASRGGLEITTTGRWLLMFASGSIVGVLLLLGGLFLAQPAAAVEAICPGGSSPRSDIKFCVDFDNLTGCTTGLEDACWLNNGYDSRPQLVASPNAEHSWKVLGDGGAVGLGYAS